MYFIDISFFFNEEVLLTKNIFYSWVENHFKKKEKEAR